MHPCDRAAHQVQIPEAAQVPVEAEADTTHPTFMHAFQVAVGNGIVDTGDAAITYRIGGNGIESHPLVGAVNRRMHDDSPIPPDTFGLPVRKSAGTGKSVWIGSDL